MKRFFLRRAVLAAAFALAFAACEDQMPVSFEPERVPVRTVQVVLPWEAFGASLEVYGGYGTTTEVYGSVLANDYREQLDARVLAHLRRYPWSASVRDAGGTTRPDSAFTFTGGRIVLRMDTLTNAVPEGPVTIAVSTLTQEWEARTVSWSVAVDTLNDFRTWDEPGAGPVVRLGEITWDPTLGDSALLEVDSAVVAMLGDTISTGPGLRFDLETPGERLAVVGVNLRLYARPNINRDTLVTLNAGADRLTFIYDPEPEATGETVRIGGAPAWRTVLRFNVPRVLTGPAELCAKIGCPFTLSQQALNNALLVLTSEMSAPAFQPPDTIYLDARAVVAPELLPKSPLSSSLIGGLGIPVPPVAFADSAGRRVSIPITNFLRTLLSDDPAVAAISSLALLTPFEPLGLGFATFAGPNSLFAPELRLLLTVADTVVLP